MNLRKIGLLAAIALIAGPAVAQDLPFEDNEPVTVVDALVVRAYGGPALWRVSDADTTVFILASPGPIPRDVTWNNALVDGRLAGANRLILPPGVVFGPGALVSIPMMLIKIAGTQREGERMERRLDPPLRARFVAAREGIGEAEERYGGHPPGMAAMLLYGDAYEKAFPRAQRGQQGARGQSVEDTLRDLARAKRVPVDRAATYGIGLFNDVLDDLKVPGVECMVSVLDELNQPLVQDPVQAPDGGAAVRAWAEGDVRPLLERASAPRPQDRGGVGSIGLQFGDRATIFRTNRVCAEKMTATRRITEGFMTDQVKAITEALNEPGHSVAVVRAVDLLRKDGVLDQLKQKGFTITLPNVTQD